MSEQLTQYNNLPAGDMIDAEELVFSNEVDLRSRCESVYEVVNQGALPLQEALSAYAVSLESFLGFVLFSAKQYVPVDRQSVQKILSVFLNLVDTPSLRKDTYISELLSQIRQLSTAS